MQDNNRYLNLIRATELAKRKGEPYIPFDGFELDMFTKFSMLDHLPQLKTDKGPEGWDLHGTFSSDNYQTVVDNFKIFAKYQPKNTYGVMVDPDKKHFLVFVKE